MYCQQFTLRFWNWSFHHSIFPPLRRLSQLVRKLELRLLWRGITRILQLWSDCWLIPVDWFLCNYSIDEQAYSLHMIFAVSEAKWLTWSLHRISSMPSTSGWYTFISFMSWGDFPHWYKVLKLHVATSVTFFVAIKLQRVRYLSVCWISVATSFVQHVEPCHFVAGSSVLCIFFSLFL